MSYKNCGPKETMEYALYKGEELLITGTASEIAKDQDVSVDTVRFWASNVYKKESRSAEAEQEPENCGTDWENGGVRI